MSTVRKLPVTFNYDHYLEWPQDERWELLDGIPYNMSPAPSLNHQRAVGNLFSLIAKQLKSQAGNCEIFMAPVDLVLDRHNVVQPDLVIVCDKNQLKERGIFGPPKIVVEVLSPSTWTKDQIEKKALYARFGIAYYLLVDVHHHTLTLYKLENGEYGQAVILGAEDVLEIKDQHLQIPAIEIFQTLSH